MANDVPILLGGVECGRQLGKVALLDHEWVDFPLNLLKTPGK
jgi:hypothetical protein